MPDWMEELLEEARRRGEFADLPGKGKPLNLGDANPFGGPQADVYKLLKDAGFTPEWVELRRQIAEAIGWLRQNPAAADRQERIATVNQQIARHNQLIPSPGLAFPKLPADFGQR